MANAAISWVSRRQKTVALSVGEAEYMEFSDASRQNTWLRTFLTEIGFEPADVTPLCGDNQSSIFLAVNHIVERQTKHIDVRHHHIWEQLDKKKVELFYVPREDNPADILTKPLFAIKIVKFREALGLWCHSSRYHQKCIAKIGSPILVLFLIPLTEMFLLMVGIKLSDRFLFL